MPQLEYLILTSLAYHLSVPVDTLCPSTTFADQGVDSLIGLRLAGSLQRELGIEIDAEWLYDYPSVRKLATFLATQCQFPVPNQVQEP